MSPALKYMQRSQRAQLVNMGSEEKPIEAIPRRSSLQLSQSDTHDRAEHDNSELVGFIHRLLILNFS